jgi:hypothetical protein
VSDARGWLAEASRPKPKPGKPPRKKPFAPAAPALRPDEYASLLKDASKDNAQFDRVVEQLGGDKTIKKAEMRQVALLFLGYELAKKKGREDALTAIKERQRIEARQEARGSVLDRLKPWKPAVGAGSEDVQDRWKIEAFRKRLRGAEKQKTNWQYWIGSPTAWLALVLSAATGFYTFLYHSDELSVVIARPDVFLTMQGNVQVRSPMGVMRPRRLHAAKRSQD